MNKIIGIGISACLGGLIAHTIITKRAKETYIQGYTNKMNELMSNTLNKIRK